MPSRRIRELFWWIGHFENELANQSGWRAVLALLVLLAVAAPARALLYMSFGMYAVAERLTERIAKCRASGGN